MKKILLVIAISISLLSKVAFAKEEYPNLTGQVLFESRNDRILSSKQGGIPKNNVLFNIEPDFSLNFSDNWSVKTGWRIFPIERRQYDSPERSSKVRPEFFSQNRGVNIDSSGLIVEELKIHFENEDMKLFAGKYNPTFATMYRRSKRVGLFVSDFAEEYELREKIGLGVSALLEDSEITLNGFFDDTTGLSSSALKNRKSQDPDANIAGNTSTLSSYSVTIEGEKLFGVRDLFYNFGYRSLGVEKNLQIKRETAYTANIEYLSVIPLVELVKINNFTGRENRDAEYLTTSLIIKYSGWTTSLASVFRNIDNNYTTAERSKSRDNLLQFSIGYKFTNNIAVDVSRARLKEDGNKGDLIGIIISYLYKF